MALPRKKQSEATARDVLPQCWSVYVLRCDGRVLYTGITTDLARRMAEHAAGPPRGARFTRAFSHLELVYHVFMGSRSLATRVEARIKNLSRQGKEALVQAHPSGNELLKRLGILDSPDP